MAALVPINVLGYAPGDPVTSVQMNLVNTQIPKAPNWVDGGATYNPAAQLVMGGAGMRWNGPTLFAGTSATTFADGSECIWQDGSSSDWLDGSTVTFGDGCLVTVELDCTIELFGGINVRSGGGIINVSSGGVIDFDAGSSLTGAPTLPSGTTLTAASGSTTTVNGTFTLGNSQNVNLSPARSWSRRGMRICNIDSTGMPSSPVAWVESGSVNSTPYIRLIAGVSGYFHWIELEDLPHGGILTQVQIVTAGLFSTSSISATPTYRIVRWQGSAGIDNMSTNDSDTHTTVTWANDITHTISVNAHSQIDRAYRYALKVFHHAGVDAGADMVIKSVIAIGTVTSIQV